MATATLPLDVLERGGVHKTIYMDPFDVAASYVEVNPFSAWKIVYVIIDALKSLGVIGKDNESATTLRKHANIIKLSGAPFELLEKMNALRYKAVSWIENPDKWRFAELIRKINDLISPLADIGDLLTKAILFIPAQSLQLLNGINGYSTVFAMGWNGKETLSTLYQWFKPETGQEVPTRVALEAFFKLVNQVTYIALGILTVLSVFHEFVFATGVWVTLSAITVATGVSRYFAKNLYQEKSIH